LKQGINNVVFGVDSDSGDLESASIENEKQRLEKWAVFANDTIGVSDSFSVTPGIRYDHTNTNGDFLSPSLGVTYRLSAKTILRGYVARGFSIPPLGTTFATGFFSIPNPDLDVEKVWSIQGGVETSIIKYFWLKTTLFRHSISDAIFDEELPNEKFKAVNKEKQKRQGLEVEIKTIPVYNTSLSAGFAFVDAKNRDTGERLSGIPRYTYDIGVQYNDNKSFSALLNGHYIWWTPETFAEGEYDSFIWDFNLSKNIYENNDRLADFFFSAHNIFNGSQYFSKFFKNPQRWLEAGIKLKF
jgi:vitamin B12 transporter